MSNQIRDLSDTELEHEIYNAIQRVAIAEANLDIDELARADRYQRMIREECDRRERELSTTR